MNKYDKPKAKLFELRDVFCFAYKPIQEILDVIGETITVDKVIKPIYNFKGF